MAVGVIKSDLCNVNKRLKELLDGIHYAPNNRNIVLKPNLVAPVPAERGVITHPLVTRAFIEYLKEFEGTKISILESSSVAQNTKRVFEMTGYSEIANEYNIPILDAEEVEQKEVEWHYGKIKIPEIVFSHEYINIAKMKTHIGTKVSLGMKNQKGLITNADKKRFHLKHKLTKAVEELSNIISPNLTILDGIIALEGDGPGGAGIPVEMNALIAGADMIEVDNAGLLAMGFCAGEVEYIPVKNIDVIFGNLDEIKRIFLRANSHRLNLGNVSYYSCRSCSGCTERLAMGLKRLPKNLNMEKMNVLAGSEAYIPENSYPIVCYGNCTQKFAADNNLPFLEGCPPNMDAIYSFATDSVLSE